MFAYNIKSPAYLTFVKILPSPKSSPNFCKRSVHLRIQFVRFHVISMNVESSKSVDKFHDFLAEADKYQIDMLLVAETWRNEHEETFLTVHGHQFSLSGGSLTWSTWCWKCCWAVIAFTYVKHRFSCIFRPAVFITFHFWNVFLSNFIFLCLRRMNFTTKLNICMSCYFQIANTCVPQQWWGVTSMQCWSTPKGWQRYSRNLWIRTAEWPKMDDGSLAGPGLEWLCQADWIPKFVLWHAFNLKIGGHSKIAMMHRQNIRNIQKPYPPTIANYKSGYCWYIGTKYRSGYKNMAGLHLEFVGWAHGMKSYMYGTLQCNQFSNTHTTNSGQTALCHHWKLAGYIANLPPNREATPTLEWQPRAKRAGRRPKKGISEMEAVGHHRNRCRGQPCFAAAINPWIYAFCRRWIAVSSHLKDWRAGLDSLSLSLFIAVRNTSQIQICLGRASRWKGLRKSLRRPIAHVQAGGLPVLCNIRRSRIFWLIWLNRYNVWRSCVVRQFGCKCVSVRMMWVSQRKCGHARSSNVLGTFVVCVPRHVSSQHCASIIVSHYI